MTDSRTVTEPTAFRLPRAALLGGFLGFFVSGGVAALYGPSAPAFRRLFEVSEFTSGLPASVHPLAALVGVLGWAAATRRGVSARLLAAGAGVLAIGAVALAAAPSMALVLATAVLVGVGFGVLSNGMNSVYPRDTGPRTPTVVVCMHGVFGVGAVTLPLVLSLVGHRVAFLVVGMLALLAIVPMAATATPPAAAIDLRGSPTPRRHVLAFSLVFGTYVAVEAATATWLATYVEFRGWDQGAAARWTSGFWLAITGGRFLFALVLHRIRPGRLVQIVLPLAAVALGLASVPRLAPYALVAAGLFFAPVFPTAMVWLPRALPDAQGATTAAILAAIIGASLSPFLVGLVGSLIGLAAIPVALALLALLAAVVARTVGTRLGHG
ncbi:sugar MFS transporter [Egicoccus sp. AB-alg6-2]|uniref:MFS transporter n=1 Tax=Egicoccus sp. AB-alg6-2 TaxID=3242692 RepID=UPI00359DBE46